MTLDEIKEVIKLMSENDLTEFHIENDGFSLNLKRGATPVQPIAIPAQAVLPQTAVIPPMATANVSAANAPEPAEEEKTNAKYIESPMVGTFFLQRDPSEPPYVEEGASVKADTVVGVIEAMKTMNEIKAGKEGVIKRVLVGNASPVEYGEKLFEIE